jgi:hypothetical protein
MQPHSRLPSWASRSDAVVQFLHGQKLTTGRAHFPNDFQDMSVFAGSTAQYEIMDLFQGTREVHLKSSIICTWTAWQICQEDERDLKYGAFGFPKSSSERYQMAAVITWCLDLAGLVALCGVAMTPPVCQPLCHPAELICMHSYSFGEKGFSFGPPPPNLQALGSNLRVRWTLKSRATVDGSSRPAEFGRRVQTPA